MANDSLKIRFVVATRESKENFHENTFTGKSIKLFNFPFLELRLFPENREGLSKVYNIAINESAKNPAILVFIHDDVLILDYYWADTMYNWFQRFQILCIAGNINRTGNQPSWYFLDKKLTPDKQSNLSGLVGHGENFPPKQLNYYGRPLQEVKILDGLLIAVNSDVLIKNNLKFDERFSFHLYDVDFSRQAEEKGIKMGTIPMSVIHKSPGGYVSEEWKKSCDVYFKKWNK